MAKTQKTYDIFISYATGDAPLAKEIANVCRFSGLEPFLIQDLPAASKIEDAIWEALAESRALLIILSPSGPTTTMSIEIGAARAWNKPIFAVTTDPSSSARLPVALSGMALYTIGRLDEVIATVKASGETLTDDDRAVLAKLYVESGIPVDRLALEPRNLREIVDKFRKGTGKAVVGERLLSEMLRMRKQGRLKAIRGGAAQPRRHGVN